MNKIKSSPRLTIYVFLCLLLFAAVWMTMRARSQSGGTIYGCYKQGQGQLRVVAAPGQCGPSEVEISWGGGGSSMGQHHQESTFTMGQGQTVSLPLPAVDKPVHIVYSATGQTDSDNAPVAPLWGAAVAVKEAATGLMVVDLTNLSEFSCGDSVQANEGAAGDVEFIYYPAACGQNSVTVHVSMWF